MQQVQTELSVGPFSLCSGSAPVSRPPINNSLLIMTLSSFRPASQRINITFCSLLPTLNNHRFPGRTLRTRRSSITLDRLLVVLVIQQPIVVEYIKKKFFHRNTGVHFHSLHNQGRRIFYSSFPVAPRLLAYSVHIPHFILRTIAAILYEFISNQSSTSNSC